MGAIGGDCAPGWTPTEWRLPGAQSLACQDVSAVLFASLLGRGATPRGDTIGTGVDAELRLASVRVPNRPNQCPAGP